MNPSGGSPATASGSSGKSEKPKVINLALFGLGRAGCIHLGNIISNPRVNLVYVVESDKSKWQVCKDEWNLSNVEFVSPEVGFQ